MHQIREAKPGRSERRNKYIHEYSYFSNRYINRQKNRKYIEDLNNTINPQDLIDIYRTFYPATAGFTFLTMYIKYSLRLVIN